MNSPHSSPPHVVMDRFRAVTRGVSSSPSPSSSSHASSTRFPLSPSLSSPASSSPTLLALRTQARLSKSTPKNPEHVYPPLPRPRVVVVVASGSSSPSSFSSPALDSPWSLRERCVHDGARSENDDIDNDIDSSLRGITEMMMDRMRVHDVDKAKRVEEEGDALEREALDGSFNYVSETHSWKRPKSETTTRIQSQIRRKYVKKKERESNGSVYDEGMRSPMNMDVDMRNSSSSSTWMSPSSFSSSSSSLSPRWQRESPSTRRNRMDSRFEVTFPEYYQLVERVEKTHEEAKNLKHILDQVVDRLLDDVCRVERLKIAEEVVRELFKCVKVLRGNVELSEEDHRNIHRAVNGNLPPNHVLVEKFRLDISVSDVRRLAPRQWLNDEIVNFYFEMIQERSRSPGWRGCSIHIFSSYFVSFLTGEQGDGGGHSAVRRWTKKVDVFNFDKILIPVNISNVHWILAVINVRDRQFEIFDSMAGSHSNIVEALRDWLLCEHLSKRECSIDLSDWINHLPGKAVPQQMNGCDCGVFTCVFAEAISRDHSFDFSQSDMPFWRERILADILRGSIVY